MGRLGKDKVGVFSIQPVAPKFISALKS